MVSFVNQFSCVNAMKIIRLSNFFLSHKQTQALHLSLSHTHDEYSTKVFPCLMILRDDLFTFRIPFQSVNLRVFLARVSLCVSLITAGL